MQATARRHQAASGGASLRRVTARRQSGLFFLSASGLLFEVALTRLCSAALSYHLTFLVVGAALLGGGAGGVWVALRYSRPGLAAPDGRLLARLALGGALAIAVVGVAFSWVPLRALGSAGALISVLAVYPLVALPFAFQSAVLALALREAAGRAGAGGPARQVGTSVSSLYGSSLLGGSTGVLLAGPMMDAAGPPWAVALAAGISIVGAGTLHRLRVETVWATGVAVLALAGAAVRPHEPNVLAMKPLAAYLDPVLYPEATHSFTRWDSTSRIDVFEVPGVSLLWDAPGGRAVGLPEMRGLTIDGDALTAVVSGEFGQAGVPARRQPSSVPYAMAPRERVLVIGPGGGIDVEAALAYGARRVDAVEVNPGVAAVMLGPMAGFTDNIYRRPGVRLVVEDGRSFLRRAAARGERYDVIVLTAVDSWAAVAGGAYSLAESFLYTREAFAQYYDRLQPDGVLAISRWYDPPAREIHRLAHLAQLVVARDGGDAARQSLVLRTGGMGTLAVRRGAFPTAEVERARGFARGAGYAIAYDPSTGGPDAELSTILSGLAPAGGQRPPSDDRPYFFDTTPWWSLHAGPLWGQPLPQGHAVLLVALVQSLCIAVAAIVLPLRRLRSATAGSGVATGTPTWSAASYFALVGVGFSLAEMALLPRYQLLLGQPTRATVVVLGGMLAGAGIGSLVFGRGRPGPALTIGAAALATHALGWHVLAPAVSTWDEAPRMLGALLAALVLAVPLGAAVPAGLRYMRRESVSQEGSGGAEGRDGTDRFGTDAWVPWAWGINAAAGVLGFTLAQMLAMDLGLTVVLALAGVCYLAAAWIATRLTRPGTRGVPVPATGGRRIDNVSARRTNRGAKRVKIRYS